MLAYLSHTPGIGGRIKSAPEDFIVEEVLPDGTVLEVDKRIDFPDKDGRFLHFVLQKRNWTTERAIKVISSGLGISHTRFSYAGNRTGLRFLCRGFLRLPLKRKTYFQENSRI